MEIRNYLQDAAGRRSLVFDLSMTHDRFGSSRHVQQNTHTQNGLLSHTQEIDAQLRLAAQRKINGYRQQYADNMGSLVHTGLGSSYLVAHVLPYPSPPPPCKQLCTRSCSNKHTLTIRTFLFSPP
jgi:hypothetical protein